jgi:hypothetical protein
MLARLLGKSCVEVIDSVAQVAIQRQQFVSAVPRMRWQWPRGDQRLAIAIPQPRPAPNALPKRDGLQRVLHTRAEPHPLMAMEQERPQVLLLDRGRQIAGKRFSSSSCINKPASRRSCLCFRVSAWRIFAGWPT